MEMRAGIR